MSADEPRTPHFHRWLGCGHVHTHERGRRQLGCRRDRRRVRRRERGAVRDQGERAHRGDRRGRAGRRRVLVLGVHAEQGTAAPGRAGSTTRRRCRAWPRCSIGPLDVDAVLARRDEFTHHHDDSGQVEWAEGAGIDVVRGRGRLTGEKRGRGHGGRRRDPHAARPARRRPRHRHDRGDPADRRAARGQAVDLARRHQPARGARAGRGDRRRGRRLRVGDMAARARRAEVTVIEVEASLLAHLEPFARAITGRAVRQARRHGPARHHGASRSGAPGVKDTGIGTIHGGPVTISAGGSTFEVDEIVVAAGRAPASSDLGLERIGLDPNGSRLHRHRRPHGGDRRR